MILKKDFHKIKAVTPLDERVHASATFGMRSSRKVSWRNAAPFAALRISHWPSPMVSDS